MKHIFSLALIVVLSSCSLLAQIHRTNWSSPLNYNEQSLDLTCEPCQGLNVMLSHAEGTGASSSDDFLSIDSYSGSTSVNNITFPDQLNVNNYSIYEDAVVKRILDATGTTCTGYLVSFTAKTNQAYYPGTSYFFETHVIKLDQNLNRLWHRIPFNNVGFSTFAVDMEVNHSTQTALLLMRKNGNRTLVSEMDITAGTTNSSREIDLISGASLSCQPQDLIRVPSWPGLSDPAYAVVGNAGQQVALFMLKSNLSVEKRMIFDIDGDGVQDETVMSVAVMDDDLFIAGTVEALNSPSLRTYTYIMRVQGLGSPNSRGNVLWAKRLAVPDKGTKVTEIVAAPDGTGVILVGQSNIQEQVTNNTKGTPFILKVDGSGNVLWGRKYHQNAFDEGLLTDVAADGARICACGTQWPDMNTLQYDLMTLGADAAGIINAVCDSQAIVNEQPLFSVKTLIATGSINKVANDYDVMSDYDGVNWNINTCIGSNPDTISGIKWIDLDCDGTLNGLETGESGWTIELRDAVGNVLQTTTTDALGNYSFNIYVSGNYYITEINQTCYNQETPANNAPYYFSVPTGAQTSGFDFGNCPCDDLIGINPPPNWVDRSPAVPIHIRDIVEFDGHIIACGLDFVTLWDDVTGTWTTKYSHTYPITELHVFDGKLFLGGVAPAWFDASIYGASPSVHMLPSLALQVFDFETLNGDLYACGGGANTPNIWRSPPGIPLFVATSFPTGTGAGAFQLYQLGALYTPARGFELVVIGDFGNNIAGTVVTSENIVVFHDPTATTPAVLTSLSTSGLTNLVAPNFEGDLDIISLNNKIHICGGFSSIGTMANTQGYAIFDANITSTTPAWVPGTGTTSGNPWDMDLHNGHIYIVGNFTGNFGTPTSYATSVVFDGVNYHPLNTTMYGNVLYATNILPDGKDKLVATIESLIEFASCGGSNCAAYVPSDSVCPNEPFLFQPFVSFVGGTFLWDFGNGQTSTMRNPSHSYILPGAYTVTLTFDDSLGCSGQVQTVIHVVNDPNCTFVTNPMPWEKLYGDYQNNKPIKIKRTPFNEILVLGNVQDSTSNTSHGTLSKFDASTGSLIWHFEILDPIEFRDIEFNLTSREYLITGFSTPFCPGGVCQDNLSAIIKVTDNGSTYLASGGSNLYQQNGREYFEEITRHKYPPAGTNGHNFYFTGARNYNGSNPPPPGHRDEHVIGNMDINRNTGTGSWYNKTYLVGDDEYQKGLFTIPTGEVVTVGNSYPGGNNYGIILELDPITGALVNGIQLNDIIDLYHGVSYSSSLPTSGELYVVCGEHWGSHEALIVIVDNFNQTVLDAVRIPELKQFEEIFQDQYGFFYAISKSKDPANDSRNFVVKFHIEETAPASWDLVLDWSKSIDDGESEYFKGHIYVDEQSDFIYYVDGRKDNASGYNMSDMMVAVFDLDMTSMDCIQSESISFQHVAIPTTDITNVATSTPTPLASPFSQTVYNDLDYLCNTMCIPPCILDWTWVQDDCYGAQFTAITDPSLSTPISYEWDIYNNITVDYTVANPYHDFINAGTYDVCLTVYDAAGVLCGTECKSITIGPDTRIPTIGCPSNIYRQVQACERGDTVFFISPIATDCDDTLTVVCSHQSGDFFPCGVTTITCSATDQEGNTATCAFQVVVECSCISMSAASLECSGLPDTYNFNVTVTDLTGSGNNCTAPQIFAPQPGVVLTVNSMVQTTLGWNVQGSLFSPVCPALDNLILDATMTCVCPDGFPVTCSSTIYMPTICCDSVFLDSLQVCRDDYNIHIAPSYFGLVKDIQQANWYVSPIAPCGDTLWTSLPFKSSVGYQDLVISPGLLGDKICYQLELILGADEGPCKRLISNVGCIEVCDPIACSMSNQSFCYTGTPITPSLINLTINNPTCDYTIEWFLVKNGNYYYLPNTNQLSYQPPPLTITNTTLCSVTTIYEAQIISACDTSRCQSAITLYSDAASLGTLDVISGDSLPLCYGEDVILEYTPNCLDPGDVWDWYYKNVSSPSWQPLVSAGTRNPLYNSNPLYENTMYKIEAQNGVCPLNDVLIKIGVKPPIQIGSLLASALDSCCNGGVDLSINIPSCLSGSLAICDCFYEVKFIKDGQVIYVNNFTTTPAQFQFINPALMGNYSGKYQVIVKDNCCGDSLRSNVVHIKSPPQLALGGPCFACDLLTPLTLTSVLSNPLPGTPSYQWYHVVGGVDMPLLGETAPALVTTTPGLFKLIVTWSNGCSIEATHFINDCSTNNISSFQISIDEGNLRFDTALKGLELISPSGYIFQVVATANGQLQSVPCVPDINNKDMVVETLDVGIEDSNFGIYWKYIDSNATTQCIFTRVDTDGNLINQIGPQPSANDMSIEYGHVVFESAARGLVLESQDGNHWRLVVDDNGNILTELVHVD